MVGEGEVKDIDDHQLREDGYMSIILCGIKDNGYGNVRVVRNKFAIEVCKSQEGVNSLNRIRRLLLCLAWVETNIDSKGSAKSSMSSQDKF